MKTEQLRWNADTCTWIPENDRLFGKVDWDEKHGIVVKIDSVYLTMEELKRTLGVYEGWYFEIKFYDRTDVEAEPPPVRM